MNGTRLRVVAVAAVMATVVAACGGGSSKSSSSGSSGSAIKIGFFGALTGSNSPQLGINIRNGEKLAMDQYNKTAKTKVTLVPYDSQGDPAQAPQLAQKAISDKVVAVIGPAFSGESKAADPIFEQGQIPNLSASATNAKLQLNGWKYFHRLLANDDKQGPADADYISKKLAAKKVAVIDDASEYGKGLGDVVRSKLGSAVTVNDSVDPKAAAGNYSSTVNKVNAGKVDAVFYGGYYQDAGPLLKQLRDGQFKGAFVSGDGSLDQKLIDEAGTTAAEGAYITCACLLAGASSDPAAQQFTKDYKASSGADPGTYSAEAYDGTNAVLKAIAAGNTTAQTINQFLTTVDFKGITKEIKFDPQGEVQGGAIYMYQVKDGKLALLGDVNTLI
ncbi:MAG: branched-chain amino acid ABC transporter substrate-binding protein [Acidimicrobiia bacterium]|nr:branched-chain amino acid ABC transporter substrate-binding protein [Acidimicrobiia bacterium]